MRRKMKGCVLARSFPTTATARGRCRFVKDFFSFSFRWAKEALLVERGHYMRYVGEGVRLSSLRRLLGGSRLLFALAGCIAVVFLLNDSQVFSSFLFAL